MEPGGEAVTRAGPAGASFDAPRRWVLLSGGLADALAGAGVTTISGLVWADAMRLGVRGLVIEATMAVVERELQALAADPARLRRLTGWVWIDEALAPCTVNS
jgi:hypothetical protein